MSEQLENFTLKDITNLRDRGVKLFRKLRIPFIRTAIPLPEQMKEAHVNEASHPIHELHIEQTDTPAVYEKITSAPKFQEVVSGIMRQDCLTLLQQIKSFLSEHNASMPSNVAQNIEIISKYVVQFQKRMQMTLRTTFEDCNDVQALQEKARQVLTKSFSEGFITHIMPALLEGLKTDPNYYRWLITYFNDFLEQYGIYSKSFNLNQEIDYDLLSPAIVKETDNPALHGKIADLLLLPYFFNDEQYQGHALLCEGQCIAWKAVE